MADSNDGGVNDKGTKHQESNDERAFAFLRTNHRPPKLAQRRCHRDSWAILHACR